jgi:hypothetical protein
MPEAGALENGQKPHPSPASGREVECFLLEPSRNLFLLRHGLAAADKGVLLDTPAVLVNDNPVAANLAFKRRALLGGGFRFGDLLKIHKRVPILTKTVGNNISLDLDERTREKTIEKEE